MGKGGGNVLQPPGMGGGHGGTRTSASSPVATASRAFSPAWAIGNDTGGGGGGEGGDDGVAGGSVPGLAGGELAGDGDGAATVADNSTSASPSSGSAPITEPLEALAGRNGTARGGKRRRSEGEVLSATDDDGTIHLGFPIGEMDEVGYLMLEDSNVTVCDTNGCGAGPEGLLGKWLDAEFCPAEERKMGSDMQCIEGVSASSGCLELGQKEDDGTRSPMPASRQACQRCQVLLSLKNYGADSSSLPTIIVDSSSAGRFDGTTPDMKGNLKKTQSEESSEANIETRCLCGPRCQTPVGANRSDAALLIGLALRCQDLGAATIRNAHIVLREKIGNVSGQDGGRKTASKDDDVSYYRAGVVLTISISQRILTSADTTSPSKPASKRARRSSFSSGRSKYLPPDMQLLLALLRCDWDRLSSSKCRLESPTKDDARASKLNQATSLFPPTMALDELYKRIRGARSHTKSEAKQGGTILPGDARKSFRPLCDINFLPEEILISHVVPFLRAQSLHSLRVSSSHLHMVLRPVVPGLKLRLFSHQIASLEWMRRREAKGLTEDDTMSGDAEGFDADDDLVGGDYRRAASGGATVLLCPRRSSGSNDNRVPIIHHIDGKTGNLAEPPAFPVKSHLGRLRRFARGGLLCDDPGLGKTITVLSLVLQTFGLSTEKVKSECNDDFSCDTEVFRSYWREGLTDFSRAPELRRLVNNLRRSDQGADYFEFPIDPDADGLEDYHTIVKKPIAMREILEKIDFNRYGGDFEGLCSDVDLCFRYVEQFFCLFKPLMPSFGNRTYLITFTSLQIRNAMLYNPPEHPIYCAASRLSTKFKELVEDFKKAQANNAKKAYSSISANPDSSVAAILAEKANEALISSLYPSAATLIIVPNPLLKHWRDQIKMHIDFKYCSNKIPLICVHSNRGLSPSKERVIDLCQVRKTHYPMAFVDEGTTSPLPPADFLSMFLIVITTSKRITSEWKYGSAEEELSHESRGSSKRTNYRSFFNDVATSPPPSPLLKVYWLRLVVDEGHTMGRGSHSNTIQFASWITAQRRWAMTGTPTQQSMSQSGLRNILGLMKFLKHDFFSAKLGGDQLFSDLILRAWNEGHLCSFFRLRMMLSLLMVRHTKNDIEEIPPPRYIKTHTDMSQQELMSYNTLVTAAQMNIKTTSMKGKTSGWQDSLLNPRQSAHASRALENIRLACCGGTFVSSSLKHQFWMETIEFLKIKHNVDHIKRQVVENYLHRATSGELSSCMCCGLQLQTLFVVPCGDLVCTECIDSKANVCPVCQKEYDVDDFQRLQPGMEYEWVLSIKKENAERAREAALRRALSDARRTGNNNDTSNNPANADANEENNISHRRRKKNHQCSYSRENIDGKCLQCHEEHWDCNFLVDGAQCSICYKHAEDCPDSASKALYVTNKLLNLRKDDLTGAQNSRMSSAASSRFGEDFKPAHQRRLKVIVFSQFRSLLDYVGDRLIRRFGGSCVAEYWGQTKEQELKKFSDLKSHCFCLLMGKEGSHGLDLSFVTHIILLDELYDKSLERQVVARAYRMGATGQVEVEQLIARHSIEELMEKINERESNNKTLGFEDEEEEAGKSSSTITSSNEKKRQRYAKLHYLLRNVRLARTTAVMAEKMNTKQFGNIVDNLEHEVAAEAKDCQPPRGVRFEHILTQDRCTGRRFPDCKLPPAKILR